MACFSVFAGAEKPIRLIAQVRRDLYEIFPLANLLNNWKKNWPLNQENVRWRKLKKLQNRIKPNKNANKGSNSQAQLVE